ncbi:Putative protease La-like protein [Aggregatibacter actinomycetemcomitans serotype e str. SC1083]|uniref:endopeptidase La n=1 Tax=Aggregatibacter actinomycetemcomitans serotype e str. SC1083 TaxID=907488 RepID=G4A812_AGGAC|nr:Lon protease family protein [Aggregatibacter actinomycetemcomitans]EGY34566.1 Putative protease La-like protein [Aggregatibacter actinomycetemcomitans serotype e str. SC1083]KYK72733.1 peptidase [Aggregatibacter actinomycetemcomitans serotype e str. SA3096]KYK77846.1 peptidase [Aggregatibacter actinomycetemcomitans serotype e str. SC936]TYB22026.1 Lon protease family protein [Aggregatibacter actinomycetemcomitans]
MTSSSLSNNTLSWQALRPELSVTEIPSQPQDFFSLQPRAGEAICNFIRNSHRTLLVLKADDQAEYAALLEGFIAKQQPALAVNGVQYIVEQGDSFSFPRVYTAPAQSVEDNFAAQKTVATALYFDQFQLFGSVKIHASSHDIQLHAGLVHQLNHGVLIVSAGALLAQFDLWQRLKQILTTGMFDWYSAHPFKTLPCEIPSYPLQLKVIVLGNRTELAMLEELEEGLYQLADYGEIESYCSVKTAEQQQQWMNYVQTVAQQNHLPPLELSGFNKLYQLLVRDSENRHLINVSPLKLKTLLTETALLSESDILSAVDFERYFLHKTAQYGFLREQTYDAILQDQIYVATEGEMVGQINGLSVIEYPGMPLSFGEPSRISCIVQFGDGEIVDVERKNELAGNIHSKGIMIAEACLANILELPSQLPFSASLVFEQSYGEIDGDSASLAGFCVLLSALSALPLPQSIAITGAIDQFGLVHSVGGVNDKIEGFFTICQCRGLTGKQGVMIPSAVLNQLSLSEAVVSAVKNQEFFIYPVETVDQACEILLQRDLVEQENKTYDFSTMPLSRLINQRIEQYSEQQSHKHGLWDLFFGRKNR